MNTQHAQEPREYHDSTGVITGNGIAFTSHDMTVEVAKHIVACVNACAGLLEHEIAVGVVPSESARAQFAAVQQHNAELQAKLDQCEVDFHEYDLKIAELQAKFDLLAEEAAKYHDQLLECKNNWHDMKQKCDGLAAALLNVRQRTADQRIYDAEHPRKGHQAGVLAGHQLTIKIIDEAIAKAQEVGE